VRQLAAAFVIAQMQGAKCLRSSAGRHFQPASPEKYIRNAINAVHVRREFMKKIVQSLYDFLDVGKSPRPADCIFVLAGKEERKAYGIKMWRFGYASQLILSVGRFEWRKFGELGLELMAVSRDWWRKPAGSGTFCSDGPPGHSLHRPGRDISDAFGSPGTCQIHAHPLGAFAAGGLFADALAARIPGLSPRLSEEPHPADIRGRPREDIVRLTLGPQRNLVRIPQIPDLWVSPFLATDFTDFTENFIAQTDSRFIR
jgi:hypothetical protein